MPGNTYDIITIGSATRDVFVSSKALDVHEADEKTHEMETCFPMGAKIAIDEIVFETGGGGTNAAATFAQLGLGTAAICAVGDDASARDVREVLDSKGISTKFVQSVAGKHTAYSIIIVAGSGERTILVHRGASRSIDEKDVKWKEAKASWYYVTSLGGDTELLEKLFEKAEENDIRIAWNPGNCELELGLPKLKNLLRKVDILNLNREEGAELSGADRSDLATIISRLKGLPRRALIITDGPDGAYVTPKKGDTMHATALDVPKVNTTGAGDAFGSGFVAGLLRKDNLEYALAVASWNAASCIQEVGAKHGLLKNYPDERKIQKVQIKTWKSNE